MSYLSRLTTTASSLVVHDHSRTIGYKSMTSVNGNGGLIDKKTRQPLLRAEAREAVKRLRVHIKADCMTDPVGCLLYTSPSPRD